MRTVGFYKTHPEITQSILDAHGPIVVCGHSIADTGVGDASSALEAMCLSPQGDPRLQLGRQLTAASLTIAAGGAPFDIGPCNATCADPNATTDALSTCVSAVDSYNMSGDNAPAPFDPPGSADPVPCDQAADTPCTIFDPSLCAP